MSRCNEYMVEIGDFCATLRESTEESRKRLKIYYNECCSDKPHKEEEAIESFKAIREYVGEDLIAGPIVEKYGEHVVIQDIFNDAPTEIAYENILISVSANNLRKSSWSSKFVDIFSESEADRLGVIRSLDEYEPKPGMFAISFNDVSDNIIEKVLLKLKELNSDCDIIGYEESVKVNAPYIQELLLAFKDAAVGIITEVDKENHEFSIKTTKGVLTFPVNYLKVVLKDAIFEI